MSLRLKELNEKRGAKLKQASDLIAGSIAAKRDLSAEERSTIDGLHKEVETLDQTLTVELRQVALESQRAKPLSEGEGRSIDRFSIGKVLNHIHRSAKGANIGAIDGVEAEMLQEGEKEAREAGIASRGIALPRILVRRQGYRQSEKRAMTATGSTSVPGDQGGMTIVTQPIGLLDDFYNASVIRGAGATVLEGLVGNINLPRLVAGSGPTGLAENAAASANTPGTAMLSLTPQRIAAYTDISEQLLMQSDVAIMAILRGSVTKQMVALQETAFFHGQGTNEAEGIFSTNGIGSVAGGTNGADPTLLSLIALETAVDLQNALLGNLHYITNGAVRGYLKGARKLAGSTDSRTLLDDDGLINGYDPFFTNAISRTLTKGTSAGVCSAIAFGDFSDYYIGYWGGVMLEMIRDKTNAISGLYSLVTSAYYDGGVVRPKSFSAQLDALTV